jgi:Spy/CpxP family protein refolding chaperone
MKKLTTAILLIGALAATLLFAQTPPKPPDPAMRVQHRVNFLTTVLSLTAAQQQQATTIFTSAANTASSLHSNMKTAHENLRTAIKSNDTAGIDQAAATIGGLTKQLTSAQAKAHAAFYQILTPDQQNKLNQLESERGPGPKFGMGPGLMGPGPHH